MGADVQKISEATWDSDVMKAPELVLVDFWAVWCGPCQMVAPIIDELATEYAGKVKVGKLDVDSNGGTAMRYNIRGIPTLLLFKGGNVVEQRVGAVGKSEVQKMIEAHV